MQVTGELLGKEMQPSLVLKMKRTGMLLENLKILRLVSLLVAAAQTLV